MRWKYCLPEPWNAHEERIALEDVFLLKEEGIGEEETHWITIEGLHSRTGGTREEKLHRLGDRAYVIDDGMDMLVRKEEFDQNELLDWIREFIRAKFDDPEPVLLEGASAEFPARALLTRPGQVSPGVHRPTRFLFVYHPERLHAPTPDALLENEPGAEIRCVEASEAILQPVPSDDLEWSDIVIVMDKQMRALVHKRCKALGFDRRLICLYMPEQMDVNDPAYASAFRSRIRFYFQRLGLARP